MEQGKFNQDDYFGDPDIRPHKKTLVQSNKSGKVIVRISQFCFVLAVFIVLAETGHKLSHTGEEKVCDEKCQFSYWLVNKPNELGDFMSGTAGLLLAFTGVLLYYQTLKDQREDINLNMHNIALLIEQIEIEQKAHSKQMHKDNLQRYDNLFLALFNNSLELSRGLEVSVKSGVSVRGKSAIKQFLQDFIDNKWAANHRTTTHLVQNGYEFLVSDREMYTYVQSLHAVIEFIFSVETFESNSRKEFEVDTQSNKFYLNWFSKQLTYPELFLYAIFVEKNYAPDYNFSHFLTSIYKANGFTIEQPFEQLKKANNAKWIDNLFL